LKSRRGANCGGFSFQNINEAIAIAASVTLNKPACRSTGAGRMAAPFAIVIGRRQLQDDCYDSISVKAVLPRYQFKKLETFFLFAPLTG
jgi:hypothetical protein